MHDSLLIELLTEELPPRSLKRLSEALAAGVFSSLKDQDFLGADSLCTPFATPRRLAMLITGVADKQADKLIERKGPPLNAALGGSGQPTPALSGFAKSCGVEIKDLQQGTDTKGNPCYVHTFKQKGEKLGTALIAILVNLLPKLPVAKTMRWGDGNALFVRPVHGFLMLHGKKVLKEHLPLLEIKSGQAVTLGHRFLSKGALKIAHADKYEELLESKGKVIAGFAKRKERIRRELEKHADGAEILWDEALLDEVTALVEWPVVYSGAFDKSFLDVPQECLVLSMQQHQKYFPLAGRNGKLLPRFLIVSNMPTANPKNIIHGNERVLRARLADAKFFYDQDRKTPLETRVPKLSNVVYHNKLGSQLQRAERIEKLAAAFARMSNIVTDNTARAARLAKADLLTEMVGEFPELQGIMGQYYARHDGEQAEVCQAIKEHYQPRFAGDALPESIAGTFVALADKLDALIGLFGIGQQPSGDKDPFALRRHALGLLRILIEKNLQLDLKLIFKHAVNEFHGLAGFSDPTAELLAFLLERLRSYLREKGYTSQEIESVLVLQPPRVDQVIARIEAVRTFSALPEANSLATANKRISNILKKADAGAETVDNNLLKEPAEKELARIVAKMRPGVQQRFAANDYTGTLKLLVEIKEPVDRFFNDVLVMTEDMKLRANRIALLHDLHSLMNQVADISKLAVEK